MSNVIMLIAPPSNEESNFHVDETPSTVLLKFIKYTVEDVLYTGHLDIIPSWKKIEKYSNVSTKNLNSSHVCQLMRLPVNDILLLKIISVLIQIQFWCIDLNFSSVLVFCWTSNSSSDSISVLRIIFLTISVVLPQKLQFYFITEVLWLLQHQLITVLKLFCKQPFVLNTCCAYSCLLYKYERTTI